MTRLIDVGLVVPVGEVEGEPRFGMLGTIREFGLERLAAGSEEEETKEAHARYFLGVAEQAGRGLFGAEEVAWLRRLEAEHDNLRAALGWAMDEGGGSRVAGGGDGTRPPPATRHPPPAEMALRFAGSLWWFWATRGHLSEGEAWQERILALSEGQATPARAAALSGAAWLTGLRGAHGRARGYAEEALAIGQASGDAATTARARFMVSYVVGNAGDRAEATAQAEASLALYRELNDARWIPFALNRLGIEVYAAGELERAAALYEEALVGWRAVGHPWGIGTVLINLGLAARERGDDARAAALYRECLPLALDQGDRWGLVELLLGLADIAVARGQVELGARLAGAAGAAAEAGGITLQPYVRRTAERTVERARAALGAAAFGAASSVGQGLSLEQAVEAAAGVGAPDRPAAAADAAQPAPPPSGRTRRLAARADPAVSGLTAREVEVLRLVAEGCSDREIGETLFVSPRTVGAHVASIYGKLGINSRAAAAAFAVRQGLTGSGEVLEASGTGQPPV